MVVRFTKVRALWLAPTVPEEINDQEYMWRFLVQRVLQAIVMMAHPAYKILEAHVYDCRMQTLRHREQL